MDSKKKSHLEFRFYPFYFHYPTIAIPLSLETTCIETTVKQRINIGMTWNFTWVIKRKRYMTI